MSSTPNNSTGSTAAAAPTGETALLARVQSELLRLPPALPAATALSHIGEHALGWMAISALGAVCQPARRQYWVNTGVAAFGAHAASVVIKRVVRRRRPNHPSVAVGVATPSRLSFPSSHATSTTAFALLAGYASGLPGATVGVPATLVPTMAASRLALGVHYPTDVLAGVALGAGSAALTWRAAPAVRARLTGPAGGAGSIFFQRVKEAQ